MDRSQGALCAALMIACGLGCGSSQPRFGSLEPNARSLEVKNSMRLVELTNGMRVAMAPDTRTNLVSVDVRYEVGAAQDPRGRAGLAHLLEHLTFLYPSGSNGATIGSRLAATALWHNAATSHDYTHYMSTALAERVDALLELEAQRMEATCTRLDDAQVLRERDVVLQEEAQRRSEITDVWYELAAEVWGPNHPYARPLTTRDMAKATKADACAFFDAHYAPSRATLIVTGNFDPEALQVRIGRRFGPIARAPSDGRLDVAPPNLIGTTSEHTADVDRAFAQVYLPAPAWGAEDEAVHDMVMAGLGSELRALQREEPWITEVDADYAGAGRQRATVISLVVADPARLDRAVDLALARGRELFEDDDRDGNAGDDDDPDDGPVLHWIGQIRARLQTVTMMRADAIQGRGFWLGHFLQYTTHNSFMIESLRAVDAVTPQRLVAYTARLFDRRRAHVGLVRPTGTVQAAAAAFVPAQGSHSVLEPWRDEIDPAEAARPLALPRNAAALAIDDYRLGNGLRVLLFLDPASPVIDARMIYGAGAVDEVSGRPGVAELAADQLAHDRERRYVAHSLDRINWVFGLGTLMWTEVGDTTTVFHARGLGIFGDWHVWRLSWLLDQGVYPAKALEEHRRQLRALGDEDDDGASADTAFRVRLFGFGHPYAAPPPTAAQRASITLDELEAWRRRRLTTGNATLVVTGGFDRAKMKRTIDELFGPWAGAAAPGRATVAAPSPGRGPSWLGVNVPGAPQAKLRVGFTARSSARTERAARLVLAEMVQDRLRIVREGMGATYSLHARYTGGAAGTALELETSIDAARAPEAAAAVMQELARLRSGAAADPSDFARARRRVLTRLLATSRDATTVADQLEEMVEHGLDLARIGALAAEVAQLAPPAVAAVAAKDLDPQRMVVAVHGRPDVATATLTALGATGVDWFEE